MRNRAFLKVVLLGLLTFAFVPGLAGAASQGQDLTGMLASSAAERAAAVSGPIIDASPSSHDFGRVSAGSSSVTFDFTIFNNSTDGSTLTISAINHSGPGFTATADNMTIAAGGSTVLHTTFSPLLGSSGPQSDNVTFTSDASNGTPSILLVGIANNAPEYTPAPDPSYTLPAFVPFSLLITAHDQEADPMSWSIVGLPLGATFAKTSDTDSTGTSTATLAWTPAPADAGPHPVTVEVSDGAATASAPFTLNVTADNSPPTANPGGPYNGVTGFPVAFDGTGSSDPDGGQTLTYAWDFGDGSTGSGSGSLTDPVSHIYAAPGNYLVSLTVTDNGSPALSNTAVTSASIVNFIPISIVLAGGNPAIIKTSGNGTQRFGIECLTRAITSINRATIKISTTYPNAGSVPEIAIDPKGVRVGDINSNLIGDLDFQLRASEVAPLLSNVPNNALVTLVFTCRTAGDNVLLRGTIDLTKKGNSSGITSAAAPNPFKPETNIKYTLRDSGPVSIRIYSVNGQLVRSLREENGAPGAFEVRWNGKDDGGRVAPSGIYFVSIKQGSASSQTRVVLAR